MVAAGILLSRIFGLVRQRAFAHYLGNSDAADAFMAAFRIPNLLQNLFGEGALSASFIPVYAGQLGRQDIREADRTANAVLALLGLVVAVVVLAGVLAAPLLVSAIAPGFTGDKRTLTIQLVRILFPGAGLLVVSAWCLGVLNSHRKFFMSYAAPVVWNVAVILALVVWGGGSRSLTAGPLATAAAWGSVVGSALQVAVQLPQVFRLLRRLRPVFSTASASVQTVIRNFVPAFFSRGVVQISIFVDELIATLLPAGAVAAMAYSQTLAILPVSLFGLSVSAAELPQMSRDAARGEEVDSQLRQRLDRGLRQIAFFVVPSAVAFATLGHVVAGAIYQTGEFTRTDTLYVWGILAGSAVGLLASTLGRLYASTYYALKDTRTPLRYAMVRLAGTVGLGFPFALLLPGLLGLDPKWGAAGLTVSAGIAGWIEFVLLRRTMNRRIGRTGISAEFQARLWAGAVLAAMAAWAILALAGARHPILLALVALIPYGLVYFGVTSMLGVPEAKALWSRERPPR
ncbi:MAG: murein biosynthesis integral membrane protein MurJ [Gemmatimonadales bacterium]|nr:murein biosynthesis integral membrane protein MurJ [Gemmatimonadales bacterium]